MIITKENAVTGVVGLRLINDENIIVSINSTNNNGVFGKVMHTNHKLGILKGDLCFFPWQNIQYANMTVDKKRD